jgi:hypothetical protein
MKNKLTKIVCLAFVGAALAAAPAITWAADTTNAPAKEAPAPKPHGLPLHGTVASVETNAMTFTVGNTTLAISSATKIFKDRKPAVFADIAVGDRVSVSYLKDETGKATAMSVRLSTPKAAANPAPPVPAPATGSK